MPICPRCGQQIPEGEYERCPVCGAFLGKRFSDLTMALIYALLLLGGFLTALIYGMYYSAHVLVLGGIISFAVLLHEKRGIIKGVGFFVGSLLTTSWVLSLLRAVFIMEQGVDPITSALLILLGISLMYYPFKDVEWTDSMYYGGSSIFVRLLTGILTLRPVALVLGMLCVFQGTLLISGGQSLLDIFTRLGSA